MTAPEQRSNGLDANARGIVVLLVAVVIGFLLLANADDGGNGGGEVSAGGADTTTTVPVDTSGVGTDGSTTTTSADTGGQTHEHSEVDVLVLNGTTKAGIARENSDNLASVGYTMGQPGDATTKVDTTSVYYADGFQADAKEVAETLGKASDVVAPKPDTPLGPGSDSADVVVVLGDDTPAAGTSGESTTSTTG